MKKEQENKLNEVWETPEVTVLGVNGGTELEVTFEGDDGVDWS